MLTTWAPNANWAIPSPLDDPTTPRPPATLCPPPPPPAPPHNQLLRSMSWPILHHKSRNSLRLGNLKLYRTRSLYCCLSPLWCEWYSDSREVQQQQQRGCWPTTASLLTHSNTWTTERAIFSEIFSYSFSDWDRLRCVTIESLTLFMLLLEKVFSVILPIFLQAGGSLMIQDGILERILFSFSINRTIMVTILHNKLIRSINNWELFFFFIWFCCPLILFTFSQTWSKYRFARSLKFLLAETNSISSDLFLD